MTSIDIYEPLLLKCLLLVLTFITKLKDDFTLNNISKNNIKYDEIWITSNKII